jgi:hypothetical protein
MIHFWVVGLGLIGWLLLASTAASPQTESLATEPIRVGTQVGERFPDFVLPSLRDGKMTSLSSFRGKKTLLIQFASW